MFTNLNGVKAGDKIEVENDRGEKFTFIVRETRRYDAAADALDVFTSKDGEPHLNIITCDGLWDEKTQQYSERLVVFADKH